jgi:hypothetical protein
MVFGERGTALHPVAGVGIEGMAYLSDPGTMQMTAD